MNSLIKSALTLITILSLGMPALASASSFNAHLGETGIIQTPYSIRGRFLFINRISRRTLRQSIIQAEPVLYPKEIV